VAIETQPPGVSPDVMLTLAALTRETQRIGLVATGSTTFNEPFNLARQLKALDVLSHGRAGWNAVTSSSEEAAANYGRQLPSSADRYGRAHEMVQLVQASGAAGARTLGCTTRQVGSSRKRDRCGPSTYRASMWAPAARSTSRPRRRDNPVIVHAGGSPNAHELAGRFANVVISSAFTMADAWAQRQAFRAAATRYGQNPDELNSSRASLPVRPPLRPRLGHCPGRLELAGHSGARRH
jgi:alkanesulfonate monooxygenase SsuD/methylene tetrahydromethanopterin reductase-like flavin-dependent oxidoreductase (luciferase family)